VSSKEGGQELRSAHGFTVGDKVITDLGVLGVVEDIIDIQGKPYLLIRWKNKSKGAYGFEEIKRYGIRRAP
jgi:hypothetical protein